MKHLKSKISRVLVLYIVLFSSVVTLVLTAIQLRKDYVDRIDVIHQRIDQVKLTNIDSITQAMWTLDQSSVQIQLNGLSRIHDIIFVKIIDKKNKLVALAGEIDTSNTISKDIKLSKEYRGKETELGVLTIVATKENIYQELIDTVIVILISQGIKTFLVSMFILVVFYYLVTRHLQKIAEYSAEVDLASKPRPLDLCRSHLILHEGDELESVVGSINRMSNNIYEAYVTLISNQQELAEREAKFSAIFESITDAVVIADNEREIVQINSAFYNQFGYSLDELEGHTTKLIYAKPEEYGQQGKKRYNVDAKSQASVYEIDYRRKDGSVFPSETMGGAIKLRDGTQFGFMGIIRDVSARKYEEEEKNKLQKQLQQAQKMEAIGQLTGGIAHDFNNIMASILGYSELTVEALKNYNDEKLNKYLERITIAGERARDLVAQLLVFSRSAPVDPKAIALPALIDDVISILRPTIPSSIQLITEIEPVPQVFMDDTQIHQMLINLCINARDAMEGSGQLTISLSYNKNTDVTCSSCNEAIQGEYIKLTVADTGSGIEHDVLEKIFDPFLTTKEVGKGTGMGLSVVHGILHKHNSHIVVETELNHGSQFELYMPPYNQTATTVNKEESDVVALPDSNDNDGHLLLVDDEESVVMFLRDLLEIYGYEITSTTSSKEAVNLIKQTPGKFDLIITDQTMPEMTGTDMIKEIFQITPDIPVILCSGYNEQVGEEQALELGCTNFFAKPVNNKILVKAIDDILSARKRK